MYTYIEIEMCTQTHTDIEIDVQRERGGERCTYI